MRSTHRLRHFYKGPLEKPYVHPLLITAKRFMNFRLRASSSLDLCKAAPRFNGLPLAFNGWLLIGPADFQLLEQSTFRKLVFQNLQGLFHIIVEHFNFQIISPSNIYGFSE